MVNKNNKKKKWPIVLLVVLALIIILFFVGRTALRNRRESANLGFDIHTVTAGDMKIEVKGSGSVESLDITTHYAKIAGQVDELLIENGDIVSKGDIIAELNSSTIDTNIDGINSQITMTQSNITLMRTTTGSTSIRATVGGVVKVIHAVDEQDVNIAMENHGSLMILSIDGRMKVDAKEVDSESFMLGDMVSFVIGEETVEGIVYIIEDGVVTFTVMDDDFEIGTSVTINDANGNRITEGNLEINMPLEIVDWEGVVSAIKVDVGDKVRRGTILLTRDGEIPSKDLADQTTALQDLHDDLKEALMDKEALTIKADLDGIVTGLTISINSMVIEGAPVYTIQTTNELKLEIQVDELDIAMIELGQIASVKMDALSNQDFTAEITKINPIGMSINNVTTYTVTLYVEGNKDVLIGMSATVDILTEDKKGIVLIPLEAIQSQGSDKLVLMADEIGLTTDATHLVEVGLSDGVNVEILTGLSVGDEIAIRSEIANDFFFMGGGPPRRGND